MSEEDHNTSKIFCRHLGPIEEIMEISPHLREIFRGFLKTGKLELSLVISNYRR